MKNANRTLGNPSNAFGLFYVTVETRNTFESDTKREIFDPLLSLNEKECKMF